MTDFAFATPRPMRLRAPWSVERDDKLRELFAQGLSGSQIAAELGVTRNAIIARWTRLGLRRGDRNIGVVKDRTPRAARPIFNFANPRTLAMTGPEMPSANPNELPASGGKTIYDLDLANDCRWPFFDPRAPEFRYCGEPREHPGTDCVHVYCARHARLANR